MNYKWTLYNPIKHGYPPKDKEMEFPKKLFFILRKPIELQFDYYRYKQNLLIVSEEFMNFLTENNLKSNFETASLQIFSKNGASLQAKSNYYAIRFGKFDDASFHFDETGKVRSGKEKDSFLLYPNLQLKDEKIQQKIFFLFEFCYRGFPIFTAEMKEEIETRFFSPEIYSLKEFPAIFKKEFSF